MHTECRLVLKPKEIPEFKHSPLIYPLVLIGLLMASPALG